MFTKPSMLTRVGVGKFTGLVIGAIGFFAAPSFGIDDMKLRVGILFWYAAVGAMIGLAGIMTWHPILKMKLRWWFMGALIGAWMNFILVLIAWDVFAAWTAEHSIWGLTSPWWGVAEGAIAGVVISGLTTLFGGEGPETARVFESPHSL